MKIYIKYRTAPTTVHETHKQCSTNMWK